MWRDHSSDYEQNQFSKHMKKIVDTTCFSVNEAQKRLCKTIDYLRLSGERTMIAAANIDARCCIQGVYHSANTVNWDFAPEFSDLSFKRVADKCLENKDSRRFRDYPFLMLDGISFMKHASTVLCQKEEVTRLFALFYICFYHRNAISQTPELAGQRDCIVCVGSHHHAPRYYIKSRAKEVGYKVGMIDSFYESLAC